MNFFFILHKPVVISQVRPAVTVNTEFYLMSLPRHYHLITEHLSGWITNKTQLTFSNFMVHIWLVALVLSLTFHLSSPFLWYCVACYDIVLSRERTSLIPKTDIKVNAVLSLLEGKTIRIYCCITGTAGDNKKEICIQRSHLKISFWTF